MPRIKRIDTKGFIYHVLSLYLIAKKKVADPLSTPEQYKYRPLYTLQVPTCRVFSYFITNKTVGNMQYSVSFVSFVVKYHKTAPVKRG